MECRRGSRERCRGSGRRRGPMCSSILRGASRFRIRRGLLARASSLRHGRQRTGFGQCAVSRTRTACRPHTKPDRHGHERTWFSLGARSFARMAHECPTVRRKENGVRSPGGPGLVRARTVRSLALRRSCDGCRSETGLVSGEKHQDDPCVARHWLQRLAYKRTRARIRSCPAHRVSGG